MAITVPTIGTEIDVVSFGKPVVDAINAAAPSAWVNIAMMNGYTAFGQGYIAPRYRKVGDIVFMEGVMKAGGSQPPVGSVQAALMPVGFRPAYHEMLTVLFGGADGWGGPGRMDIQATGIVNVTSSASMQGAHSLVSFSVAYSTV